MVLAGYAVLSYFCYSLYSQPAYQSLHYLKYRKPESIEIYDPTHRSTTVKKNYYGTTSVTISTSLPNLTPSNNSFLLSILEPEHS